LICSIHLLSYKAFCTVIFFLLTFLNSVGAMFLRVCPCAQDDDQNLANFSSPIVTIVDAAKSSRSRLSQGSSSLFHALSFCRHWNHNHRILNARAKRSRSNIPKSPFILGRHVVGQFIMECPRLLCLAFLPSRENSFATDQSY